MPQDAQVDDGVHVQYQGKYYVFPKGSSREDIEKHFKTDTPTATMSAKPSTFSSKGLKSLGYQALDKFASSLPAIGGVAGGIAGGVAGESVGPEGVPVGGVLGADLGGAAGKNIENRVREYAFGQPKPANLREEVKSDFTAGGEQATAEAGGQVLSRGARVLAESPAARRFAARPLNRMLRPDSSAFDYGTNPGASLLDAKPPAATGKYGMKNFIVKKIDDLSRARDAQVADLTSKGVTVDARTPIEKVINEHVRNPTEYEEGNLKRTLEDMEKTFLTRKGRGFVAGAGGKLNPVRVDRGMDKLPLNDAIEFRKYLDDRIGEFDPETNNRAKTALQAIRSNVNEAIHNAAPGIKSQDSQLSGLIEARRAMNKRIAHLESGTRETTAGKGALSRVTEKFHIPGTRSVPSSVTSSRLRRGLTQLPGGTPLRQAVTRQLPKLATVGGDNQGPDEDEGNDQ
jgi:hypothetical protein